MDENLVGYLLKSLDPQTQSEVESHLRTHPEARARLKLLERALAPLAADAEMAVPPPTLRLHTLARVAEYRCRSLPSAPPPSPRQVGTPTRRWARRADWLVAASLLLVLGGLSLSGLLHLWNGYQRMACANNLRQFGGALAAYSDLHDGKFPAVEKGENAGPRAVAGIFVPVLNDAGLLGPDASVICPAQGPRALPSVSVAKLETLFDTQPAEFQKVASRLGGSYAYSLGYQEADLHLGLSRSLGDKQPILADRPDPAGFGNSPNHGGRGQNVLYIGGQVRWCTEATVGINRDHIYLNQNNCVQAGLNRTDTVLGPSDAVP
jgi:hypothetical protein